MEPAQFEDLFILYLNGNASRAQTNAIFDYIENAENEQLILEQMRLAFKSQKLEALLDENREKEILDNIFSIAPKQRNRPQLRLGWIKIAAAILVFSTASVVLARFLPISDSREPNVKHAVVNDVMPGGNKAVLTLGDGAKIILDNKAQGKISEQGDVRITKQGDGQIIYDKVGAGQAVLMYNAMTTPKGGQYKLRLPDGTVAWLNAASSIRYPTDFLGSTREVSTTGEVYFEVAHDRKKPFMVRSGDQIIEVLGTHFNINAYSDEADIKTTLLEGSVKIIPARSPEKNAITIKPNEQASFSEGRFLRTVVDAEDAVAWKNGFTSFDNADIGTIMRQVGRWYDVDVHYSNTKVTSRLFSGEIPRNATLSEVFKMLEMSDIHLRIEGKNVFVSP